MTIARQARGSGTPGPPRSDLLPSPRATARLWDGPTTAFGSVAGQVGAAGWDAGITGFLAHPLRG